MKDWAQRNIGIVVSQLAAIIILGVMGLWFRSAVATTLENYVTEKRWLERNVAVDAQRLEQNLLNDRRFGRVEGEMLETGKELITSRKEVLGQLTTLEKQGARIEERLAAHMLTTAKATP